MSKILVVLGATGTQGGCIINHVLNDAELSSQYRIRAITRNTTSTKATAFASRGVEVVQADTSNPSSLSAAFSGAHTVFAMTTPSWTPTALDDEYQTAKLIADTAVSQSVAFLIFSTLPSPTLISSGKYPHITAFDAKAKAETYIRTLPLHAAFYNPGSFMSNFQLNGSPLDPQPLPDGTYELRRNHTPALRFPLIHDGKDHGTYVSEILRQPEKFYGKNIAAAQAFYDFHDIVKAMSKSAGKQVVFTQVSNEETSSALPAPIGPLYAEYFLYVEEFGYWGPQSDRLVKEGQELVGLQGKLKTLEEYFEENPLKLG